MKTIAVKEYEGLLAKLDRALGDREFFCGSEVSIADLAAVCYVPMARAIGIDLARMPKLAAWLVRIRAVPAIKADLRRVSEALAKGGGIEAEFAGPDGKIHWRDSRLEWPIRHGFIELIAREFRAGKMMFPPDAA